jgi:hypothetical protein
MNSTRTKEPIEIDAVPLEEGVSTADAAARVHLDPAAEPNRSEPGDAGLRAAATGICDRSDPEDS